MTQLDDRTEMLNHGTAAALLSNRFERKGCIGSGGMADVYEGHDTLLDRTVAIKMLKREYTQNKTFSALFKTEAQAAARLSSPHTVHIFDVGEHEGRRYIVMEYIEGIDLKRKLRSEGLLDPRIAAQVGMQVCSALHEAHKRSIIHRDIKSSNIMVLSDSDITGQSSSGVNVKIMDFGIAQAEHLHAEDSEGIVLGTLRYMSPETLSGHPATAASDLFSLGVVLYECCTGCFPYDGDTQEALLALHRVARPIEPQELNPLVDDDLNEIILTALQVDSEKRYSSAEMMGASLSEYLNAAAHPQSQLDYPRAWVLGFTEGPSQLVGTVRRVGRPTVIGRSKECDMSIAEETLSKRHLRITPRGMYLEVEDLGSTNGTLLDKKPITRRALCQAGSGISAGNVSFRIGRISH